jgi:hypothetical protein
MFFDVTDSKFKLVDEYDPEPTGTIDTGDASYSAGTLVVDDIEGVDGSLSGALSVTGNITVGGTVDGRDVATDGTKLDGIEANATADQTDAEIKTAYENNSDTNALTDALLSKLNAIDANATPDQTAADIRGLGFFDTSNDGSGSGLDADLLDGNHASAFATLSGANFSGQVSVSSATYPPLLVTRDAGSNTTGNYGSLKLNTSTTGTPADGLGTYAGFWVDNVLKGSVGFENDGTFYVIDGSDTSLLTVDSSGNVELTGDVSFGDNDKAIFGAGDDLQIYHDGSNSYIKDTGTGRLTIQSATDFLVANTANTQNYIYAQESGYVRLYYSGATKLATTSTGIDVTGTVTADGLNVLGTTEVSVLAGTNASTTYHTYKYNTSTVSGYIGNGSSLISGANNSDFIIRSQGDLVLASNGNNRSVTIDTSNNVGIGTDSPTAPLTVQGGSATAATIQLKGGALANDNASIHSLYNLYLKADSSESIANRNIIFQVGSTDAMRITSGGDLLIGTTDTAVYDNSTASSASNGHNIRADGKADHARYTTTAAAPVLGLNRIGSDGYLAEFRKDGSTVGSIGTQGGTLEVGSGDVYLQFNGTNDWIKPVDGSGNNKANVDLGTSGAKFKDLYLSGKGYFSGSTDEKIVLSGATNPYIRWQEGTTNKAYVQWNGAGYLYIANSEDGSALRIKDDLDFSLDGSTFYSIWHEGNDGSGSGLDADTLDGIQATGFLYRDVTDSNRNINLNTSATNSAGGIWLGNSADTHIFNIYGDGSSTGFLKSKWGAWDLKKIVGGNLQVDHGGTLYTVWDSFNDGSGSGLDADLLDGQHASAFQPAANELTWVDQATGNYGTIKVDDDRGLTWAGYAIRDHWVLMFNGAERGGIYNDTDNEWALQCYRNAGVSLYYNGSPVCSTTSAGLDLNVDSTDVLNFTANSTNDSRGISFNSRTALSADYNDGWMRLNQNSEFTNGTYSPKRISSSEQIVAGNSTVTSGGQLVVSNSSNPYFSFHESASRRAYIQYLTSNNALFIYNEEAGNLMFRGNAASVNFDFQTTGATNTGRLFVDADDFAMRFSDDESIVYGRKNANTWLYYNGEWRIRTNTQGVDVRSDTTSSYSQIGMLTGAGDVRGYLYANTSNDIGILDAGGNWGYRHRNDTEHEWKINDTQRMHLDNNGLEVITQYGDINIGPTNSSYCHITTDRPQFYFNQKLIVNSGTIQSYDEDLNLNRVGSTTARLRITSSSTISDQDLTVNSDERIKDNIELIDSALDKVQAIRGVTYNRTDTDDPEKEHTGVIAQDVEKVLPQVVHEDDQGIKSVAYGNMVGLLIEAIKEQQTQIDDLKAEVTRLKGFE